MALEDVGFENDSLLTLNNSRCGDFTPKADVGEVFEIITFKPSILKHHIPEHPRLGQGSWGLRDARFSAPERRR